MSRRFVYTPTRSKEGLSPGNEQYLPLQLRHYCCCLRKYSWAGLPGLRRDTRTIIKNEETVRGITLADVLRDAGKALVWSDWGKRDWMFHEDLRLEAKPPSRTGPWSPLPLSDSRTVMNTKDIPEFG